MIRDKFSAMLSNRKWTYVEVTPILKSVNRNVCIIHARDMVKNILLKHVAHVKKVDQDLSQEDEIITSIKPFLIHWDKVSLIQSTLSYQLIT